MRNPKSSDRDVITLLEILLKSLNGRYRPAHDGA
jgi:hypothetical protein